MAWTSPRQGIYEVKQAEIASTTQKNRFGSPKINAWDLSSGVTNALMIQRICPRSHIFKKNIFSLRTFLPTCFGWRGDYEAGWLGPAVECWSQRHMHQKKARAGVMGKLFPPCMMSINASRSSRVESLQDWRRWEGKQDLRKNNDKIVCDITHLQFPPYAYPQNIYTS